MAHSKSSKVYEIDGAPATKCLPAALAHKLSKRSRVQRPLERRNLLERRLSMDDGIEIPILNLTDIIR